MSDSNLNNSDMPKLLGRHAIAKIFGKHPRTMARWEKDVEGFPPYVQIKRTKYYRFEDVALFIEKMRRGSGV